MREVAFTPTASVQYDEWAATNTKIRDRIKKLLKDIVRDPFKGIGKPEPLRHHHFKGCWSRRITLEHRLVYKVTPETIMVLACKYHYK